MLFEMVLRCESSASSCAIALRAIFVELQEALRIPREIAAFHSLVHKIDIFADESDVEHDFPFVNNSSTQNFISASLVLLRYSD